MGNLLRQLKIAFVLFLLVIMLGTVGYHTTGLSWGDSLYQTVVTVSTVGYSDLSADRGGKPFTIVMVMVGVITVAIFISLITGVVVEAQIQAFLGRRKVEGKVRRLNDHIVLCGFGRFGRTIAAELQRRGTPFVILESDPIKVESAREHGYLVLEVDATEEESLTRARVEDSIALLSTLGSDAENVYVTLSAKQMNRAIKVVAVAQDDRARAKLKAAGADEVVSPYALGANWMAQVVTSPTVADVLRMAIGANPLDFYMDEHRLAAGSPLCGKQLKDTEIRRELGVIVVAVRRAGGELITNPPSDLQLEKSDVLVSLGGREPLDRLKQVAAGA
ncbi:MAG: potassium channel family protein [Planctomycetota bacterium]